MKFFSSILLLLFSIQLNAQKGWSRSFETFQSSEEVWDMVKIGDKLYLQVVGFCANGKSCSSIIEMNTDGELLNNYNIEQGELLFDLYNSMLVDGERIINLSNSILVDTIYNGTISSFDINTKEFVHKKLTTEKGFFAPTNIAKWKGTNNFIALGQLVFNNSPDYTKTGITILDSMLNIIIDTTLNSELYSSLPADLYQDTDTSFIYFVKGSKPEEFNKGYFIYSYRINNKLEIISTTKIGKPIKDSGGIWIYVEPMPDGNFLLTWRDSLWVDINDYEVYVCKLDQNGKELWKTTFKLVENFSIENNIYNLLSLKNGDYLIIGSHRTKLASKNYRNLGWAVRFNGEGKIIWEKNYNLNLPEHIKNFNQIQFLYDGVEGEDGSIYMCGSLIDTIPGLTPPGPNKNNWVLKVGPDGCLIPGCTDSLISVATNDFISFKNNQLSSTPNPANSTITLTWKDTPQMPTKIAIRNTYGIIIKTVIINDRIGSELIDISDFVPGMYVCSILGDSWQSAPSKFIKL